MHYSKDLLFKLKMMLVSPCCIVSFNSHTTGLFHVIELLSF